MGQMKIKDKDRITKRVQKDQIKFKDRTTKRVQKDQIKFKDKDCTKLVQKDRSKDRTTKRVQKELHHQTFSLLLQRHYSKTS